MSVSLSLLGTTGDICSTSSPSFPQLTLIHTHAHTHTYVLGQWLKRLPPQLQPGFSATTQITLSARETSVCAWRGSAFTVKMLNVTLYSTHSAPMDIIQTIYTSNLHERDTFKRHLWKFGRWNWVWSVCRLIPWQRGKGKQMWEPG